MTSHFNQLPKEDNSHIRFKKTCAHCCKGIVSEPESAGKVLDLMEALKASVEMAKKEKEPE